MVKLFVDEDCGSKLYFVKNLGNADLILLCGQFKMSHNLSHVKC